jgi:rod shape-determining protein MreC
MRTLVWLLAAAFLALITIALSQKGALDPLRNLALTVVSPLERGVRNAAEPVADVLDRVIERQDLEEENRQLRQQIEELRAEIADLREQQTLSQGLEELLKVQESRPDDEFLVARVIAKDPSNLKERIAIDRGRDDGLTEGMVVLSSGNSLVGVVSSVLDDFAWITLITDPNSSVNAMVMESRTQGIVSGTLHDGLRMELLPQETEVQPGSTVATSGLGGNFPDALLIGEVVSVQGSPQDIFQKAEVKPAANLPRLESVLVLTSFQPARLDNMP